MPLSALSLSLLALAAWPVQAARQPYDVRKIIDAFRQPHDDLKIICAHRGLRWNGTTENSVNAYFRSAQAGLECIETDIQISRDGQLVMVHDGGLGRETDVGEYTGNAAYNPWTGVGYSPKVKDSDWFGFMENLHSRDEQGRVHADRLQTLGSMVQHLHDLEINTVLQLDFKDQAAVEPAYWALKNLTNSEGVPANEWCIYKLQARWWSSPEAFEAEDWVQDAFKSGVQLAFIPVYNADDVKEFDPFKSVKAFMKTNYTISAELNGLSSSTSLDTSYDYIRGEARQNSSATDCRGNLKHTFATAGIFFFAGEQVAQFTTDLTRYDMGNLSSAAGTNVVHGFNEGKPATPKPGDKRSDLSWIVDQKDLNWIIADRPDVLSEMLSKEGKRNITRMLQDGKTFRDAKANGWYKQ